MNKYIVFIMVFLISISSIGCGRILSRHGGNVILTEIKDPPQFHRLATKIIDQKFPEWGLPWNSCYYAVTDVLYGTEITPSNAIKLWTDYFITGDWKLVSGNTTERFF